MDYIKCVLKYWKFKCLNHCSVFCLFMFVNAYKVHTEQHVYHAEYNVLHVLQYTIIGTGRCYV